MSAVPTTDTFPTETAGLSADLMTDDHPPFRLYMGGNEPRMGTTADTVPTTPSPVIS
jgi:hypothetical protein